MTLPSSRSACVSCLPARFCRQHGPLSHLRPLSIAQDGLKLAQALAAAGGLAAPPAAVAAALRGYERERTARAAPVTKKSWCMGAALQIQNRWVSNRTIT